MEESKRIRLVFKDDDILSQTQKSQGLNRCWVLLKPNQYATVSGVASHLLNAFHLHQSCPHGLVLSISGFVLPPFESTCILKDNEIIRVRKRKEILAIEGNNAANEVRKLKNVEKQPVNNGVLLLANDEFEKEKGGYESDDPEVESEEELMEDIEGGNVGSQNRKRKAKEKLQVSKKKRQRTEASGSVAKDVHTEEVENDRQAVDVTIKKSLSCKEEKPDSNAEANVETGEESSKSSDKNDASVPVIKGRDEAQENGKETEDAKVAPKQTKKVPSRSARRKYAKRKWLQEMAKIRKANATCESEGLKNWKEDQSKAGKNKVDDQSKGWQKWKKHQADAENAEVDDQPKGLLHWKQSFQKNPPVKGQKRQKWNRDNYFHKSPNQNGDVDEQKTKSSGGHEQPTQNGDEHEWPKNAHGDKQLTKENAGVEEHPIENGGGPAQSNQEIDDDEENEVVPIVIRPGHIRFEPLEKEEEAVEKKHVPVETFQWNGITSKKKGQQWGKENRSFTPRNDNKNSNKEYSETPNDNKNSNKEYSETPGTEKDEQPAVKLDFDKLPPLTSDPKEGDLIAYRVLELSSSWTPELSPFRVGKVSWFDTESNQTMLVPVSEYPIVSKKSDDNDDDDDDDEVAQLDSSLYKEDGSLEIDFISLIDVRIVKNRSSGAGNGENDQQTVLPSPEDGEINEGKETQPTTEGNDGAKLWDQVSEALNAKKEQLSKENSWGKTPKKVVQPSYENSEGRNEKKVQPSTARNKWGKNAQKVQPSQENSWGKQNSGGKSWSYRALRGSALGPTMAILRSNKDI